jgi:hypothetical protein
VRGGYDQAVPRNDLQWAAPAVGAYGLRLRGAESAARQLVTAPQHWPELELIRLASGASFGENGSETEWIEFASGGGVHVCRTRARATFAKEARADDSWLLHPYLGSIAAVVSRWYGRETFHAGAFAAGDGAWGVAGERGAGKSSTLAWLARAGCQIVCDDILVLDGTTALAGPRTLDLRREPAEALATGEPIGLVGLRERWRVDLGSVSPELPLRGWIFLTWGDAVEIVPMPVAERLPRLASQLALVEVPVKLSSLLTLSTLPAWELRRPSDWTSLEDAGNLLLEHVG